MRLIIDITELAGWQGKLTGVPRVMNELSLRYANEHNVQFVTWDGLRRNLVSAELPQIGDEQPTEAPQPTRETASKRALRKIAYSNPATGKIVRRLKKISISPAQQQQPLSSEEVITPKSGDTLFVLADWHGADENFINYVLSLKPQGVKLAQICYDMLPVVTPQYSGHSTNTFKTYVENIYPVCDVILAISEHTKKDIERWLKSQKLTVPKVQCFRLGDDFKQEQPRKPASQELADTLQKNKEFLLCVGTIEARKNHALLYYVYKLAKQKKIEVPPIVVAGRRGWKSDDIFEIINTDPETKDSFVFLESASDEELAWLYKHCRFSVYPSFYEGWGLPIAESIAYGAPCVASNTSSMPEVAGDVITYFTPSSTDECLAAIAELLSPSQLTEARSKLNKYKSVSWDTTFTHVKGFVKSL